MDQVISGPSSRIAEAVLADSFAPGLLVIDGYDIRLRVRGNMLVISDGIRTGKRERLVSRADGIRRIVVFAESGIITLEALRWTESERIAIAQFSRTGEPVIASASGLASPRSVQAQALASAGAIPAVTLAMARRVLGAKLDGQAAIVGDMFHDDRAAAFIADRARMMGKADRVSEMTGYEGASASAYWQAWVSHPVSITWDDPSGLPSHWRVPFRGRSTGTRRAAKPGDQDSGNRDASDPVNAMLNFAYKIAETEAIRSCRSYGIDPGIGFMHAVGNDRPAMALDLIESARPICDRIVLETLAGPVRRSWCYEGKHGVVRLAPPLTHMFAIRASEIGTVIDSHAGYLADALASVRIPDLSPAENRTVYVRQPPMVKSHHAQRARHPVASIPGTVLPSQVISDPAWQAISAHVPVIDNAKGPIRVPDRLIIAALVWMQANGQPANRLPETFPVSARTIRRRVDELKTAGAWPHVVRAIRRNAMRDFRE